MVWLRGRRNCKQDQKHETSSPALQESLKNDNNQRGVKWEERRDERAEKIWRLQKLHGHVKQKFRIEAEVAVAVKLKAISKAIENTSQVFSYRGGPNNEDRPMHYRWHDEGLVWKKKGHDNVSTWLTTRCSLIFCVCINHVSFGIVSKLWWMPDTA